MNKIKLTFGFIVLFSTYAFSQGENHVVDNVEVRWENSYSKAQSKAKKEGKPLLLFFTGSDWCGPCKRLVSDFFESERFKEVTNDKFVLYEADFPRNRDLVTKSQRTDNNNLKAKYNISAYPTIILINEEGNVLGKRKGYNLMRDPSYHFDLIESVRNIK